MVSTMHFNARRIFCYEPLSDRPTFGGPGGFDVKFLGWKNPRRHASDVRVVLPRRLPF